MTKKSRNSILDRLSDLDKKMFSPKTSAKEMKLLEIREKNLLEMLEEGMDEFNKGGAVQAVKKAKGGMIGGKKRYMNGGMVMPGRGVRDTKMG